MSAGPASLVLALLPAAWLLPNHYLPWVSAWQEGLAILTLAVAAMASWRRTALPGLWLAAGGVALVSIVGQAISGRIAFAGDALMAAAYIGVLMLSVAIGVVVGARDTATPGGPSPLTDDTPSMWALGTAAGATLCVAIALVQWTDVNLAIRAWIADLPPWGRPFSNLAQPNHFCTAAFLGFTALALLRETGRIGAAGFWVGTGFMLLGMVMSGSRTAWVQLGIAAVLSAAFGRRSGLKVRFGQLAAIVVVFALLQSGWSRMDDALGRHVDRPLDEKLAAGARPALWHDMLAAIAKEPLWGHGWQQVGAAQQSVALDRPPVAAFFDHFDHAHNIVLDLLIWAGIPAGGLIALLCVAALWREVKRLTDPRAVWLMAGALGLVAHGLLEFPLEFAYFLIPLGVALGMVHRMAAPDRALAWPPWALPGAGVALLALLVLVAFDYLKAEESFRVARLEIARIGTDRITSQAPDLRVLTQLEAFLHFVRTQAKPGMSAQEMEEMRRVSRRFGYSSSHFRYAIALGLNGRPDEAARTLKLICHIHSRKRCQEVREIWPSMQEQHEALRAVPAP